VDCLRIHTIRKKKIDGMKIGEFIERCDEEKLYLLDIDAHLGREMNFKVYNSLSGIFDMWIDAAPRRVEDIMDTIIVGAQYAIINDIYFMESLKDVLELTDSVILKSYSPERINNFLALGGRRVMTSTAIAKNLNMENIYVIKGREVCEWRS